jgi:glutamate dehydrogenase
MVKNGLIVPVGAKGGFVLKHRFSSAGEARKEADRQYARFMRCLLSLTDNVVADEVVHPPDVVCHDGDDAYLVVAADKGTAHLSDVANRVAEEEAFWLGDAFASGGSRGYDHKREGITARGAWVCAKRHLLELGIDIDENTYTVAGIGDM